MQLGIRIAAMGLLLSLVLTGCGSNGDGNPVNPPGGGGLEMNSGSIGGNGGTFAHMFAAAGTFPYHCSIHSGMTGSVTVQAGGPAVASVNIANSSSSGFQPGTITVGVGGTVTWTNSDNTPHTVTSH